MRLFSKLKRSGQILCIVILGCSSILGLLLMRDYQRDAARASASASNLLRFIEVLRALNTIAAERGPTNAIVAASAERPDLAANLAASRLRSDQSLALIAVDPEFDRGVLGIRDRLRYARSTVDAIVARPATERTSADVATAVAVMVAVIDKAEPLVEEVASAMAAHPSSSVAGYAVLIRALSDMRDYAGRMGSALMVPLALKQPMTPEQLAAYDLAEGRVFELQHLLSGSIRTGGDEETRTALDDAQARFFGESMRVFRTIIEARRDGFYPMDREALTASLQPGFRTLETLRDVVAERAWRMIVAEEKRACRSFIIVTGLTLVMIGLECLLLLAAQRFIFSPLLDARITVLDFAAGRLDDLTERPTPVGEMGELFGALTLLKTRLQERDTLDREYRRLTEQLRDLADRDGLTGVLNRGALERIAPNVARGETGAKALGLILIDIDHFKTINDSFGHGGGDYVLKVVACRWGDLLSKGGIFARFGGEEFAALVPDADIAQLHSMAEQLRQSAALPVHLPSGTRVPVSASFGVAIASCGSDAWVSLLEAADAALYEAKRAGRNRVVCAGESHSGFGSTAAA